MLSQSIRIKFEKMNVLKFISHLDTTRTMKTALTSAGIPVWYTEGFNPHIKMVFGMPLPVGCESECEFLDIRIEREMSCEEIKERLNAELTTELAALEVYVPERKFTDMAFATYEYTLTLPSADEALADKIAALFANGPLIVTKRAKSGEKQVDLCELIRSIDVRAEDGVIRMDATLVAGEGKTITPEALVGVLRDRLSLFTGDPMQERYRILRRDVLLADGETSFR